MKCSFYDAFQPLGLHGRLPGWEDGQGEDEEDVQHHHAKGEDTVIHVFMKISFQDEQSDSEAAVGDDNLVTQCKPSKQKLVKL